MGRYIHLPTEVDAFQWCGWVAELQDWLDSLPVDVSGRVKKLDDNLYIDTLEGKMHVSEGDYIIFGTIGELYPCKPEAFHYEPVE